jgi:alcohol dehydrogenase (cytochrome c)
MRKRALLLSTALACCLSQAACVTQDTRIQPERTLPQGPEGNWTVYGGDLSNTRYAVSDQINAGNVKDLHLKWIFQTGVLGSFETTPLVEDGVMYVTAPYNHVFALDARSGQQLWHYEHKLRTTVLCCGPNNRGVALADDKLYMATLDAMLVALDKKSGEVVW